jgi:pyruvate formate lyase activating enzyme
MKANRGIITDIQRFSLKDGPGIRTTVFLKGCNAVCRWCHNPETISKEPQLLIYPERCIGCGACVSFDSRKMRQGLPPPRNELNLVSADNCFSGALSIAGKEMLVADVMREVEQDSDYYRTSGGGVTLSGGEVCMQTDFAAGILDACKASGFHTAIQTNLAYDYSLLEKLLPSLDMVMADIKIADNGKHQEYTGIGNAEVLKSASILDNSGLPYVIRTPVVPGVNDNAEDIKAIAVFIAENCTHLLYYELLNFNPLGDSKYHGLGIQNPSGGKQPLDSSSMDALVHTAESAGIPVRKG